MLTHASRDPGEPREALRANETDGTRPGTEHDVAWATGIAPTSDLVVSTVLRLLGARRSALHRLDRSGQQLVCVAAAGEGDPARWVGKTFPSHTGISGPAIEGRKPVWSDDLLADPRITLPAWA